MPGRECWHCKQWIEEGQAHDCWTTTEAALTRELSDDLQEAYERLRETAVDFGEQRIYASHHSIMFSRRFCYFFVRPKRHYLEVVIMLGRPLRAPQVKTGGQSGTKRLKYWALIRVTHRDQVEAPITEWLREAYAFADPAAPKPATTRATRKPRPKAKPKPQAKGKKKTVTKKVNKKVKKK
jgi:hypothetical protein